MYNETPIKTSFLGKNISGTKTRKETTEFLNDPYLVN